jgi:hypothetical protein
MKLCCACQGRGVEGLRTGGEQLRQCRKHTMHDTEPWGHGSVVELRAGEYSANEAVLSVPGGGGGVGTGGGGGQVRQRRGPMMLGTELLARIVSRHKPLTPPPPPPTHVFSTPSISGECHNHLSTHISLQELCDKAPAYRQTPNDTSSATDSVTDTASWILSHVLPPPPAGSLSCNAGTV